MRDKILSTKIAEKLIKKAKFDNFEVPCEVMHHWKALLVVFSYRTRIALGLGFVRVHQEVGQFV